MFEKVEIAVSLDSLFSDLYTFGVCTFMMLSISNSRITPTEILMEYS
jgi:hypothetical protein